MPKEKFSDHSLRRRGLLTAGADNRAQLAELMRQSSNRSAQSALGHLGSPDLRRNNVTDGVFGRRAVDGEGMPRPEQGARLYPAEAMYVSLNRERRKAMVRLYNACGERPIETCEAALAAGTAAKPPEMAPRR